MNPSGAGHHLDEALTRGLSPPLTPVYSASPDKAHTVATVSPVDLLQWLNTHFPNSHFLLEDEGEGEERQRSDLCGDSPREHLAVAALAEEEKERNFTTTVAAAAVAGNDSSLSTKSTSVKSFFIHVL